MQHINDVVKQRLNPVSPNNDIVNRFNRSLDPQIRTDAENEDLAARLAEKLEASGNIKPYLAVAYSGISEQTLERYAGLARENGDFPAKLFMFFVKREPLWREYQKRREDRRNAREHESL